MVHTMLFKKEKLREIFLFPCFSIEFEDKKLDLNKILRRLLIAENRLYTQFFGSGGGI